MKRTLQAVCLAVFAAQALVVGQGSEVKRILADIRTALGGEAKLAAVRTIAVEGQTTRPTGDGTSTTRDFDMAFELLDSAARFVKKDVMATFGGTAISRRSGFSGADLIEEVDMPPSMGGGVRMMRLSPGGQMIGGNATPEQVAAQKQQLLLLNRREFARLALGMLGTTTPAYPVEFVFVGQAEANDGKADVLEVRSADGFSARLFVDTRTHLPLMLAWMDKEPLRMTTGGSAAGGGGGVRTITRAGDARATTPEEAARMQEEMAARVKEADAKRRTVEYRVFYADYKSFDGVLLPTRIQRMRDGLPTEEMTFDKVKINGKIDASRFAVVK
jgi:hypothetical protein